MVKRISLFISFLICFILLLWGVVITLVFTPEFVTPHIVKAMQRYTKSEVSIQSVDLSLFTRFPNVTLKIDSLRITQTKDSIDDLIFARQCRIAINPFDFFKRNHIAINHVSLRDASIYLYVDSLHGPIKTFILPEVQEESPRDDIDSLNSIDISGYTLSLKRLKIDSTQIVIDDRNKGFYTRVDNFGVDLSMNLTSAQSDLDIVTGFSNLIVWHKGDLLVKKTAMMLRSNMLIDRDSMQIKFDKARIHLNDIDLKSRGVIRRDTISKGIFMDIRSSLNTPSISEFLALIPPSIISETEELTTQGIVDLDIELNGVYSDNSYPTVGATLKIDNAKAKYESRKVELERVDCDAYMFVDFNSPKNSYADIRSFHVNTSDILDLNLNGKLTDIIEDPTADLNLLTNLNFDRFTEIFPLNDGIICSGTNTSNIKSQFRVSDIQNSNYANLYIEGESIFSNLEISFDSSKFVQDSSSVAYLYMQAERGVVLFGDNALAEAGSRTLRSKANFMDLNYRSKSGESLVIKDIELMAGANFDRETSDINGFGVRGIAKNTNIGLDSLLNANLEVADISIIIRPKSEDHNTQITTVISSQEITANELIYDSDIKLSAVNMDINIDKGEEEQTIITANLNSQRISVNEPSYNSKIRLSAVDLDMILNRNVSQEWSMDSTISFSDLGMFSDLLPLNIAIPETSVSMRDKTIMLNNAHLKMGDSYIVATGSIHNLLRKLFVDPRLPLSGELSIHSPYIDFGEIIEASNHSVLMVDMLDESDSESVTKPNIDSLEMVEDSGAMFIVPKRMDFTFDLNIDKAVFESATIENLESHATLQNGTLSLDNLSLNAIDATAKGSLIYRNIDKHSSNLAADMSLESVDINRIGELLPSINSMMPMLESFEGIVDFTVKANTNINKDSQVDISTLYSAMKFKGKNLVLMDGDTFDKVSKMLMFKNKDRNLIDSLEVYALVAESKIDVLPFKISIDRYTAIIGGSQVVDPATFGLDYDYNISILNSPLPFKAGVDITGNLDDFKFKITKAKLKKTNFDDQRIIYEDYSNSIDASEAQLDLELEERRETMRKKRREQRESQEELSAKMESEIEDVDEEGNNY